MKVGKKHTLIWGGLFLLIVAVFLHINQVFVMAAAIGLLAPVSYLLSRHSLKGLDVKRRLHRTRLSVGESVPVSLTVCNTGTGPRYLVSVEDVLPDGLLLPDGERHLIVDLAPGQEQTVTYHLLPVRRGVYKLDELGLVTSDLIGLFEFTRSVSDSGELVVYPQVIDLPDMWPQAVAGMGRLRTRKRRPGTGTELYGVRDFVPGDDLRQIHWKATAHRGKLSVVQRERPQDIPAIVILDLSAGVHAGRGNESSLEYGVTLAATLAAQALKRGRPTGLIAQGAADYSVAPAEAPGQKLQILEALARVTADCPQSLPAVIQGQESRLAGGASVAVISPQTAESMADVGATLCQWGNAVNWFSLVTGSFEGHMGLEGRYRRLASQLRRQGGHTVTIHGGQGLAAGVKGAGRVVRQAQ